MKYLLLCFLMVSSLQANELLKCLGQEEKKYHLKKDVGPLYDLNQKMIAELVQIPQIRLKSTYFGEACSAGKVSPSWKILSLSLKHGAEIFDIDDKDSNKIQQSMNTEMIKDYLLNCKEIFLSLVAQIQAASPSPTCLKEEIPELDAFFSEIKYLQEDLDIEKLFRSREVKILDRLEHYSLAFSKCSRRIKMKLKSKPKPAAKKS